MESKHLHKMNLFDIVANAFADKITIVTSVGTFLMIKFAGYDFDILAVLPAILIFGAAIWKHYQKGRKEQAEAQNAIKESKLLEKKLLIADKDIHEGAIENQILLEKLEQEKIKTEQMKKNIKL